MNLNYTLFTTFLLETQQTSITFISKVHGNVGTSNYVRILVEPSTLYLIQYGLKVALFGIFRIIRYESRQLPSYEFDGTD